MDRALALAREGYWTTPPNPAVGAVVVAGGEIVGEGYHLRPGTAHAEIVALETAGERARGGTLYVTIEPCSHYGRTPPCTDAIIRAGCARVVIPSDDPCRRVCGEGIARLRTAGITVDIGIGRAEAHALNRRHFLAACQRRPLVIAKVARTLDGRTMGPGRTTLAVTGPQASDFVGRRRSEVDAVVVGSGALLADDPRLTARLPDGSLYARQPRRVVVDGRLRTPPGSRLLRQPGGPVTVVTVRERTGDPAADALRDAGARVIGVGSGAAGSPEPTAVLRALADDGVDGLILEGGGGILRAWAGCDLIDFWEVLISPAVVGAGGGMFATTFDGPVRIGEMAAEELGSDLLIRAVPAPTDDDGNDRRDEETTCSAVS